LVLVAAGAAFGCFPAATAGANVNPTGGSTIGRANLDGSGAAQSFIGRGIDPVGLALNGQHIYWTDSDHDTIGRANLDGSGIERSFISGVAYPSGLAVNGQHIYWTDSDDGLIGRANLDGGGVDRAFISGVAYPWGWR
jgi:hypothetical protein